MAHIKCRYNEIYCNAIGNTAKLCDWKKCKIDLGSDFLYVGNEEVVACEGAYADIVEFEKDVKDYEYRKAENILRIGKRYYKYIEYLEIDGRVLIGE